MVSSSKPWEKKRNRNSVRRRKKRRTHPKVHVTNLQRRRRSQRLSIILHKHQKAPGFYQLCLSGVCLWRRSRHARFRITIDHGEHVGRRLGVLWKHVLCMDALWGTADLVPCNLAGLHSGETVVRYKGGLLCLFEPVQLQSKRSRYGFVLQPQFVCGHKTDTNTDT